MQNRSIRTAVITSPDDHARAQKILAMYESLSDERKAQISQEELQQLQEKLALAQAIYNGEIAACLEDQSGNGYHIDVAVSNSKQSVNMVQRGDGLALRGWFELNQEGARERFNDIIGGSFTIEATVDLDRGTGFSYIAGKCDDCFGLRTESNQVNFYIYNGSDWKNARVRLEESDYDRPAHVVISYADGTMTLWVNGRQAVTTDAGAIQANDKCLALGIGEYDDGHTADYHNGHTFHSFRVYDSALTPEVLETITPEDEQVELWYDFDKLTYLPAT